MHRLVTADVDLDLAASADLIFSLAVAQNVPTVRETLTFLLNGETQCTPTEIIDQNGTRLHRLVADGGTLSVRYEAVVDGRASSSHTTDLETITYLRPSRYAQSDEVFAQARRRFRGLSGTDLVSAVSDDVASSVSYTPGLSLGTDSAVTTLMTGQGVCRDYAHLVIALLRAMDVPARYVACYAPGLDPMDFHAVAEAYIDGAWFAVDATRLSHRESLVRIATGRDAADCAFLSYSGANVAIRQLQVDAWIADGDPALARPGSDDPAALIALS